MMAARWHVLRAALLFNLVSLLLARVSGALLQCPGPRGVVRSSEQSGRLSTGPIESGTARQCVFTVGTAASTTSLRNISVDLDPGFAYLSVFGAGRHRSRGRCKLANMLSSRSVVARD